MGNICDPCSTPKQRSSLPPKSSFTNGSGLLSDKTTVVLYDDDSDSDEEWFDALQEHDFESIFDVSPEELKILRDDIKEKFPNDHSYLSDAYILSVASKPYSKNMSIRRPLEYSMKKLRELMEWRKQCQASELFSLVALANGSEEETGNSEINDNDDDDEETRKQKQKERLDRATRLVKALNTGSMYWHGLTKEGRPVLWIRTQRKYWYPDVPAEMDALICMSDAGIRFMPEGVTDFCCISHSHKPPPPHPQFAYRFLQTLTKGYPDRLNLLISAPVSSIVEFCMNLLLPLMPGRMHQKFTFFGLDNIQGRCEELLLNGKDDVPTFFGGPVDHDQWYPEERKCTNRGTGTLKFDFYGMMERLEQAKGEFEKQQALAQQQQQ